MHKQSSMWKIVCEQAVPPARLLAEMYEKKTIYKLLVQTVCLMMNPRVLKHVEDVKNRIKAFICKVCISFMYVA